MVFAFSPDSRATLIKLRPRPASGFAGSSVAAKNARDLRGRVSARTLSKDSTTAAWLKDWRNVRREEAKTAVPSRSWFALEFAPTLFSASLLCKFRRGRLPLSFCGLRSVIPGEELANPTDQSLPHPEAIEYSAAGEETSSCSHQERHP